MDTGEFGKVLAVAPAQLKLVRYVDKKGEDEVRLTIKAGGEYYILREKIGTTMVLQLALPWLQEGIKDFKPGSTAAKPAKSKMKAAK
jgi:hypothetical protein